MSKRKENRKGAGYGNLILVNAAYGYTGGTPGLVSPWEEQPSVLLERRAAAQLAALLDEIDGWQQLVPVSGWRSQTEQQAIWDDSLKKNGLAFTRRYVAVPGHSEHQTGLAIDLGLRQAEIDFICPDFPYEGICQRFRQRAAAYGFVERYPAGKEAITGIGHEPWHFRYVGAPHAGLMAERGMVLEEYLAFLRQNTAAAAPLRCRANGKEYRVWWTDGQGADPAAGSAAGARQPFHTEHAGYDAVSGDNLGGFVVTREREENDGAAAGVG